MDQHKVHVVDRVSGVCHEGPGRRICDVLDTTDHEDPARGEQRRAHMLGQCRRGQVATGDLGDVGLVVGGAGGDHDGRVARSASRVSGPTTSVTPGVVGVARASRPRMARSTTPGVTTARLRAAGDEAEPVTGRPDDGDRSVDIGAQHLGTCLVEEIDGRGRRVAVGKRRLPH